MVILAFSAASVGALHTLSPGHWLPVVLMAKSKKWPLRTALVGALVAGFAHILLSVLIAVFSIFIEVQFLSDYETEIERYAGLALCIFGLIYTAMALFTHYRCHGHAHHENETLKKKAPFVFLFTLGFSPCVAVLPVVAKAAVEGSLATILTLASFSLGVLATLLGSTLLVFLGMVRLNHPIFEHYGDAIAGIGIAVMGAILFFLSV